MTEKICDILLVEDNPADAILLQKILEKLEKKCNFTHVVDGEIAINFMRDNTSIKADAVLLDINMPKKNGKEVLSFIRNDENLSHTPVVMLTSSTAQKDIDECTALGANGYLVKPSKIEDHNKLVTSLDELLDQFLGA